jgi:RNA polymerase sigma-70 factor (ECF subfamily)
VGDPIETPTTLIYRIRDPADDASWSEFVGIYEPLVRGLVRKKGVARQAEDDVVQEVFARVVKAAPTFEIDRQRGRFGKWLWTVIHHAVVDHFRSLGKLRRERSDQDQVDAVEARVDCPDETWLREQKTRVLQCAKERVKGTVPPKHWACFEQHVLAGRTAQAVGDELGESTNYVYVNACRVLEKVRQQCADYMEELGDE